MNKPKPCAKGDPGTEPSLTTPSGICALGIRSNFSKYRFYAETEREGRQRKKRHTVLKLATRPSMDAGAAGAGVAADDLSPTAAISRWKFAVSRQYQYLLDKTTPHILQRWIVCLVVAFIYVVRVYLIQGFYIVSYGLGIYILNLLIGFLSPQVDPEIQELSDGPSLPTRGSDEFRPFVRRLPEFKFWYILVIFIPRGFAFAI